MTFEQALKTFKYALDCLRQSKVKSAEALSLGKASGKMAKVWEKRIK